MRMAQIHLKGKDVYKIDDDVVVYFCFPTLGVAVPLRPGDFLLFNSYTALCIVQMQARQQYLQHSHVPQDICCWHE